MIDTTPPITPSPTTDHGHMVESGSGLFAQSPVSP